VLSSKTALRYAVSSNDLSTFLEHGDVIEKQIQEEVDKKTTDWGITVLHIEITDIQIPEHLQDSLSRVAQTVDIRIRVSDFSAQKTLPGDSVTVDVDALCFWLVWDPQKAVLEVENYFDAVVYSSKTALRSAVSSHDLSTFLERSDVIEKQIQEEVDKKTTDWGITVLHIEITDIQIPEPLQNSLSLVAQAEREKKGRILLAEAEIEIAKKLEEAISIYAKNEGTMKLKILSILNEGLKAGNSMMLVPNSIAEELKTKDIFGLQALNEIKKEANK
jgi:regulator of protease activity HflC (stomatin/prohibitin superfamily)